MSFPPTQNVNSAPRSLASAGHFGGNYAKYAAIANFSNHLLQFITFLWYLFRGELMQAIMDEDSGVKAGIFVYEIHASRSFPGDSLPV
ncbi:MAG: hypothetical protein GC179_15285 [Anaerolineaceae bacterium]|nr:hypothetical protein [Anaerolineaceae bacterium]